MVLWQCRLHKAEEKRKRFAVETKSTGVAMVVVVRVCARHQAQRHGTPNFAGTVVLEPTTKLAHRNISERARTDGLADIGKAHALPLFL